MVNMRTLLFVLLVAFGLCALPQVFCQPKGPEPDAAAEEKVAEAEEAGGAEEAKSTDTSAQEIKPEEAPKGEAGPAAVSDKEGKAAEAEKAVPAAAPEAKEEKAAEPAGTEASAPAVTSETKGEETTQEAGAEKKKEEAAEAAPKPQEEEVAGIDTLGLEEPGGNWLFKRIWWEKAEARFEKIRTAVGQLFEARMTFLKKRSDIDRDLLDPFYREVGLERGELREIVLYLIERIEKMRQQQGSLDEAERDFLNTLLKEQKTLEQLQVDIDEIGKLDKAVDDAILLLAEQVNRARNYENGAWQEFKAIGKELNDKRARERYYGMDAILKSIQDIDSYVRGAFAQHFDALATSIKDHIDRVKKAVSTLRERKIDLRAEAERLEESGKQSAEDETAAEEAPRGFFGSIFHAIGDFLSGLWHLLFGWIGSSKAT